MRYLLERLTPPPPHLPRAEVAPERACRSSWPNQEGSGACRIVRQKDSALRAADSSCREASSCGRTRRCCKVQDHRGTGCFYRSGGRAHTPRRCRVRRALEGQVRRQRRAIELYQGNAPTCGARGHFGARTDEACCSALQPDALDSAREAVLQVQRKNGAARGYSERRRGGAPSKIGRQVHAFSLEGARPSRFAARRTCRARGE